MTTKAPIRKIHDIPIVEPYRVPEAPKVLPQAPIPVEPFVVPIHTPELVPVRRL